MARSFESTTPRYLTGTLSTSLSLPLTIGIWAHRTTDTGNQRSFTLSNSGDAGTNINWDSQGFGDCGVTVSEAWASTSDTESGWTIDAWIPLVAYVSTTEIAAWVDGSNTAAVSHSRAPTGMDTFEVAQWNALGNDFDGYCEHAAIWSAALTDDSIAAFSAGVSPLLIQPADLIHYWPIMGRSGTSAEIDLVGGDDLTVTGGDDGYFAGPQPFYYPATIWVPSFAAGSSAQTVTPGVASSTANGLDPTLMWDQVVTPGVASVTANGLDPTLVPGVATVLPGVATATTNGLDPTISLTITVSPGVAPATSSGLDPTLVPGVATVAPGVATATTAGLQPTIDQGGVQAVSPGVASVTANGLDPSLLWDQVAAPGVAVATSAGLQPTISGGDPVVSDATEHYPLAFIREDEPPLGIFEIAQGPQSTFREIDLPSNLRRK